MYRYAGALLLIIAPLALAAPPNVPRPKVYLGIVAEEAPPKGDAHGLQVVHVNPETPAAEAGLKPGDFIDKIGDKDVRTVKDFFQALAARKPGDRLKLEVFRAGKVRTVTATLRAPTRKETLDEGVMPAYLGVEAQELNAALRQRFNTSAEAGVVVTDVFPLTPAAQLGLIRGDVIVSVNGEEVNTPEELRIAIRSAGADRDATLKVMRGGQTRTVKVRLKAPSETSFMTAEQRIEFLENKVKELEKQLKDRE